MSSCEGLSMWPFRTCGFGTPTSTLEDIKGLVLSLTSPCPIHSLLPPSIRFYRHFTYCLPFFSPDFPQTTPRSFVVIMVETRRRNKNVHPAAPVMTEAVMVKAGIKPAKPRKNRTTKVARIRELEEEVA